MMILKSFLKQLLFTDRSVCILCNQSFGGRSTSTGTLIHIHFPLCPTCMGKLHFLQEPFCSCCGRELQSSSSNKQTMGMLCNDCKSRANTFFIHNRSAVAYNELMKDWIYTYKYRGRERLAEGLGDLLFRAYQTHYAAIYFVGITFVPLHEQRLRERKFNQAEQLAQVLAKKVNLPVLASLERIADTPKQSHKNRAERISSLRGAFRSTIVSDHRKGPILLIDDIYTTGTTLNECARALKIAGFPEIYTLTVARA